MGFELSAEVRKRRTKYSFEDIVIALDEVEGLGSFLEAEAVGDDANWEMQRERVLSVLTRLGLDEPIRSSYLELLEEKRNCQNSCTD